ncbi:MAG: LysM peptidoglycan-binding domain-containing protein [Acidobacteria bacterium]|nr:LysM peptidoglycan-binding domain-containing protein [Acidobacteriota bacterium]
MRLFHTDGFENFPTKCPWTKIAGGLLVGMLIVGAESAVAQSLGDLARQERARKGVESPPVAHVYTNEDMQRPKIVERQEPAIIEDSLPDTALFPGKVPPEAQISGSVSWSPDTPLGDIARYYRRIKQFSPEQNVAIEAKVTEKPSQPLSKGSGAPLAAVSTNLRGAKHRDDKVKQVELSTQAPLPSEDWIRVENGDSLWKLASRYLGDGAEWRKFVEANPELADPNRIRTGQRLRLPSKSTIPVAPVSSEIQQVRVQRGDSLWKLAEARFGDGEAWGCIVAVNPQINDVDRIYPGQTLTLPARCS